MFKEVRKQLHELEHAVINKIWKEETIPDDLAMVTICHHLCVNHRDTLIFEMCKKVLPK